MATFIVINENNSATVKPLTDKRHCDRRNGLISKCLAPNTHSKLAGCRIRQSVRPLYSNWMVTSPPSLAKCMQGALCCKRDRLKNCVQMATKDYRAHNSCYCKGKAIPLQPWTGPEGSRMLRLTDFKKIGTLRW